MSTIPKKKEKVKASSHKEKDTKLLEAIVKGKKELVIAALKKGGDVNSREERTGSTPLFLATINGSTEIVLELLKSGADINAVNNNGQTALHAATQVGQMDIIKLIVNSNSTGVTSQKLNIDVEDKDGLTPLFVSIIHQHMEAFSLLLDNNALFEIENKSGSSPLHEACESGFVRAVSLLLKKGANINKINKEGETPLHIAVREGFEKCVGCLIQNMADVTIKNKKSETPVDIAQKDPSPNPTILKLLGVPADIIANLIAASELASASASASASALPENEQNGKKENEHETEKENDKIGVELELLGVPPLPAPITSSNDTSPSTTTTEDSFQEFPFVRPPPPLDIDTSTLPPIPQALIDLLPSLPRDVPKQNSDFHHHRNIIANAFQSGKMIAPLSPALMPLRSSAPIRPRPSDEWSIGNTTPPLSHSFDTYQPEKEKMNDKVQVRPPPPFRCIQRTKTLNLRFERHYYENKTLGSKLLASSSDKLEGGQSRSLRCSHSPTPSLRDPENHGFQPTRGGWISSTPRQSQLNLLGSQSQSQSQIQIQQQQTQTQQQQQQTQTQQQPSLDE